MSYSLKTLTIAGSALIASQIITIENNHAQDSGHDKFSDEASLDQDTKNFEADVNFILRVMDIVKATQTKVTRVKLANTIARQGQEIFPGDRRAWYVLLAVESKFNQRATSEAGALGIGQIVPKDLSYLKRVTGVSATKRQLQTDIKINLAVSSKLFSHLIRTTRSSVLALVAYNAGVNSAAVTDLKSVTSINHESANYVTKHSYILEVASSADANTSAVAMMD
jgi:Transglycosylase SLT domain